MHIIIDVGGHVYVLGGLVTLGVFGLALFGAIRIIIDIANSRANRPAVFYAQPPPPPPPPPPEWPPPPG